MIIAICVASSFALLVLIIVLRAMLFRPKDSEKMESSPIAVDAEAAMRSLSALVRCKTVSDRNKELEDGAEFERFGKLLPELFPSVFEVCEREEPSDRSILLRWRGKSAGEPMVLMAHYDVVSVTECEWEKPPFEGIIENGVLWGRGTLDTKCTLNAILASAEALIKEGFVPKNDIYFAFGGDEEINGYGAVTIARLLRERGITPALVLDEGGAVVENVFPGVKERCALIGVAEKGMLNLEYIAKSTGGHSSSPGKNTPIERLSKACIKISKHPSHFRITKPAREMLDTLARHSAFVYKLIFANLWIFAPLLNLITRASRGELSALLRTTDAFTMMQGSDGANVIPPVARLTSNHRILPGETVDGVKRRIEKTVGDPAVEIRVISAIEPSAPSSTDSVGWKRVTEAVAATFSDAVISPYLMLACSDSRHYSEFSNKVYRFSPLSLSSEMRATIHGNNERITLSEVRESVEFYTRLILES